MQLNHKIEGLLDDNGLFEWSYRRNNRLTRVAGRCKHTSMVIEIAGWLIDNNSEEEVMNTVYHEIAHALTPGHGHDKVWSRECKRLGGTGEMYWNMGGRNVTNPNPRRKTTVWRAFCKEHGFRGHTRQRRDRACGDCCRKYNNNMYDEAYRLEYV